jgi:hypothetical protein
MDKGHVCGRCNRPWVCLPSFTCTGKGDSRDPCPACLHTLSRKLANRWMYAEDDFAVWAADIRATEAYNKLEI